jgi:hypothetical protein
MHDLKGLKVEVLRLIDKYPKKGDELREFYHLAVSEIEEGGSESHECSLAWRDMLELVGE